MSHDAAATDESSPPRPDYMVTLGLLPPYSQDDVRRAYREKVRQAHPDRGGTPRDFEKLETAYHQALEHVRFRTDRRSWIATHMEEYVAQQQCTESLTKCGANVDIERVDWLQRSLGDFSALTEYVVAVRAIDRDNVAEIIEQLMVHLSALDRLKSLSLAGCPLDDELVYELRPLRSLAILNLSRTPITKRALGIVHWLPALQRLDVTGTNVGWWLRRKTNRFLRQRIRDAGAIDAVFHPTNVR